MSRAAIILGLALTSAGAVYGACPDWLEDSSVPACPSGYSGPLPDTFPIAAHVIGDEPAFPRIAADNPDKEALEKYEAGLGKKMVTEYVEKALRASGDKTPLVFLPVRPESFQAAVVHVKGLTGISEAVREKWLKSLIHVPIEIRVDGSDAQTWQRDGVLATLAPGNGGGSSGAMKINKMADHPGTGMLSIKLAEAMAAACDKFQKGREIAGPKPEGDGPLHFPPGLDENLSPNYGGNVLGLPGGLCLHGSNQTEEVVRQYCDPKNSVAVDVDWLHVGHVDEIVSVVKTSGSAPCDFALVMPSPRKALEVMRANGAEPFFDFGSASPEVKRDWLKSAGLEGVCGLAEKFRKTKPPAKKENHGFLRWLLPEAFAAGGMCEGLTNAEAADAIEADADWSKYNELVQGKIETARDVIRSKIRERLGCSPEIIEAPALYYGGAPILDSGKATLPAERGKTVHPNLANLVGLGNRHALVPEPRNKAFEKSFAEAMKAKGASQDFVDTWDYAHRGGSGNLHCATFTVPYCRKAEK